MPGYDAWKTRSPDDEFLGPEPEEEEPEPEPEDLVAEIHRLQNLIEIKNQEIRRLQHLCRAQERELIDAQMRIER